MLGGAILTNPWPPWCQWCLAVNIGVVVSHWQSFHFKFVTKNFIFIKTMICWLTWFSDVVSSKERSSSEQVWLWHSERYLVSCSSISYSQLSRHLTSKLHNWTVWCSVWTVYCEALIPYFFSSLIQVASNTEEIVMVYCLALQHVLRIESIKYNFLHMLQVKLWCSDFDWSSPRISM